MTYCIDNALTETCMLVEPCSLICNVRSEPGPQSCNAFAQSADLCLASLLFPHETQNHARKLRNNHC